MAATNKFSAAKARKLDQQAKAMELRRMGYGYQKIADQLDCSVSTAYGYIKEALTETKQQIEGDALELKAEEISRLDGMLQGIWQEARKGNYGSIDRVLKIMERRARMLGLDAPVRASVGGDGELPPIAHRHDVQTLSDTELERIAASASSSA